MELRSVVVEDRSNGLIVGPLKGKHGNGGRHIGLLSSPKCFGVSPKRKELQEDY